MNYIAKILQKFSDRFIGKSLRGNMVLMALAFVVNVVAFPLMLHVPAVQGKKTKKVEVKDSSPRISYEDSVRFKYFFLEAERQQNADHYDAAFELLEHCKSINPYAS
ncbi:MAG: hypothetical protein IIT85_03235, partial [Prevotella sp.]|nr:hypothetical protein [Prevotella sp.]